MRKRQTCIHVILFTADQLVEAHYKQIIHVFFVRLTGGDLNPNYSSMQVWSQVAIDL